MLHGGSSGVNITRDERSDIESVCYKMSAQKDENGDGGASSPSVSPGGTTRSSDFSIEHILHRAGQSSAPPFPISNDSYRGSRQENFQHLHVMPSWLQCTRYCPPKIPRTQKRDAPVKRQLGRHPRIPFSSQQLAILEERFKRSPYLSSAEVTQISNLLQLADVRVKIWFQNRRARERREKHTEPTGNKKQETFLNEVHANQSKTVNPIDMYNIYHDISLLATSSSTQLLKKDDYR